MAEDLSTQFGPSPAPVGRFYPVVGRATPTLVRLAGAEGVAGVVERITEVPEHLQDELFDPVVPRLLNPVCTQNQDEPSKRLAGFHRLGYALDRSYEGAERALSETEIHDYNERVFAEEAGRGTSDLIVPAHRAGKPGTHARENDLGLARAAYEIAGERGFLIPGPDDPIDVPRRLLVPIIVHIRDLFGASGARLINEYEDVQCDGYIAAIAGLHDGALDEQILVGARWLLELKRRTNRDVISLGAGELYLPLLDAGIDVFVQVDGRPRVPWPHGPSKAARVERCFHPAALSEVLHQRQAGETDTHAEALFSDYGCGCERHSDSAPPSAGAQRTEHTLVCRAQLAVLSPGTLHERVAEAEDVVLEHRLAEVNLGIWAVVERALDELADEEQRGTG